MAAFKLVPTPEGINCMPLLHPSPARSTRNEAIKKKQEGSVWSIRVCESTALSPGSSSPREASIENLAEEVGGRKAGREGGRGEEGKGWGNAGERGRRNCFFDFFSGKNLRRLDVSASFRCQNPVCAAERRRQDIELCCTLMLHLKQEILMN